ncbi:MAG TPA: serine hydrolase, partial [Pyrinomonadaceae bacterium]|nr:serine hydrolase [Pyrinomonadaceae bacterium]
STVLDLAKWDAALDAGTILKQPTRDQAWTPVKLNNGNTHPYGFGWELAPVAGHKQINHGGSLPGFRAQLARFVDDKLTVAVLTNGDNANAAAIAVGVANFYIPGLLPDRKVAKVDPKIFDTYVGQYQPDPSATLSITREGDKLMMQQGQGDKRQLLPESETTFFTEPTSRTIYSFIKDDAGQMVLVIKQDDREVWRAKKTK